LIKISKIDEKTTLRVEALPTPSVPPLVFTPKKDETDAMMNPNTQVFKVGGM
jgi:hypothetical protein